jgi:hypothetical protein
MLSAASIRSFSIRAALFGGALAALTACGSSSEPAAVAKDVAPATITALSTDTVRGVVGTAGSAALTVTVKNKAGDPLDTTTVTFAVTSGGGTLSSTSVKTNAAGQATTTWTLGQTPGVQKATATVGSLPAITFTASATAGAAANITKLAGDAQTGAIGANLPMLPSVKVTDKFGNPVAGTLVSFTIASGGGSVASGLANTGLDGVATSGAWKLGGAVGSNTLIATVNSTLTTTFTATGTVGSASGITVTPAGPFDLSTGQTVSLTPRVVDASGNVLASPSVAYSSSNTSVASVSSAGVITASGPGTTNVTATSGTAVASVAVTVTGHPAGAAVTSTLTPATPASVSDVAFTNGLTLVGLTGLQQIAVYDQTATTQLGTVQLTSSFPILLAGRRSTGPAIAINAGATSRVFFIDPNTRAVIDSTDVVENVQGAVIKSDGSRAYMLLTNGELAVVDPATRQQLPRIQLGGGTNKIRIDRGDSLVYVLTTVGILFEIDARTNTVRRQIQLPAVTVTDFDISRDGQSLYLLDGTAGVVRIYNLTTANPTLQRSVAVSGAAVSLALSPDGQQIWVAHTNPNQVTIYTGSIANGFLSTGTIALAGAPVRIYFSPSGSFAAVTNFSGFVDIIR